MAHVLARTTQFTNHSNRQRNGARSSLASGPVLAAHPALRELERGAVSGEVDVLVDRVERLWRAEKECQGLIVEEPVDMVDQPCQPHLGSLARELRVQGLEFGDDGPGAVLTGRADESAVWLQRQRVRGLCGLLQNEDVSLPGECLLCQKAPDLKLLFAPVDGYLDIEA